MTTEHKMVPVELLESLLDDPALVVRMSSDKIVAIKEALAAAPVPPQGDASVKNRPAWMDEPFAVAARGEALQGDAQPVALPAPHNQHYLSERQHGWNAYAEAVRKLGPLYTRPDAGEVGDPVGSFDKHMEYMQRCIELEKERDTLRAQLAELRHAVWHALDDSGDTETGDFTIAKYDHETLSRLVPEEHDKCLSASAEPKCLHGGSITSSGNCMLCGSAEPGVKP